MHLPSSGLKLNLLFFRFLLRSFRKYKTYSKIFNSTRRLNG